MSELQLHASHPYHFSGYISPYGSADYVVLGVPYDRTSTYRPGSRFGPQAIREASLNVETFSLRSKLDLADLKMCDVGDIHVVDDVLETLKRVESVSKEIVDAAKTPVVLGGEHTLSYAAIRAIGGDTAVVDFDAHMDLRSEYMGERFSHASVMRRIVELLGADNVLQFGVRAFSKEELQFASIEGVWHISDLELRRIGLAQALAALQERLSGFRKIYVTIDMDVLDPAYAPGVGNPEGNGMDPHTLIEAVCTVCQHKISSIDLVEVTPNYDHGSTAIQAAKVLFEALCAMERNKRGSL